MSPAIRHLRELCGCCAAALALLALSGIADPKGAEAARPLETGIFDGLFRSENAGERQAWLQRTVEEGSSYALTVISWASVAPAAPGNGFEPEDPADPGYDWGTVDEFVRDAVAGGLVPVLTVTRAPSWAEGGGDRKGAAAGTWKPRSTDLKAFAHALAERYSGTFTDASVPGSGPIPRVKYFQAWTEPNLSTHLSPQWSGRKAKSPAIYRQLLNAFYAGVKSVAKDSQVITAGTGPYGDRPGGNRVRPLKFWRDVFCLRSRNQLKPKPGCGPKAKFDVLAHHPINTAGRPRQSAFHPDDVSTADLGALQKTLRKAEKHRLIKPRGSKPLWVTEFWWESNPPDRREGIKPALHARYIAESLYLFWKAGARVAINLKIRDSEQGGPNASDEAATGLYYIDGSAKPAATAFAFPFVAERRTRRRFKVWGKAPGRGQVRIERQTKGGWKRVASAKAGGNGVFTARLKLGGKPRLRASLGGERSLAWKLK